jgi:CTP synthase
MKSKHPDYNGNTKFIVVTGGVLSGLGKGIAAASIGALLGNRRRVVPVKCDGYLNTDPGTMNPTEHGEVFVLDDGGEVDMDFGHYERFIGCQAKFKWNLTMGKVFKEILEREREGRYLGKTVQFIPHLTDLIKEKFFQIASEEEADVLLIEVGGTVGDLENEFYIEAVRQLKHDVGRENILYVHLTYVPVPSGVNEQKSKPSQMSVRDLNEKGIYPDLLIGRCSEYLTDSIKRKIALFCNIEPEQVISGVDVSNVYEIPLIYQEEGVADVLARHLGLSVSRADLAQWERLVQSIGRNQNQPRRVLTIALCGKYVALEDSYASVVEAIQHAAAHRDLRVEIRWVDTEQVEKGLVSVDEALAGVQGVIIPGGFGTRGIEGKIQLIQAVRERKIPFLGICYGMQLAVVEYARNVCQITGAHTTEVERDGNSVEVPVVDILPNQLGVKDLGGTMRLGGHNVLLRPGSLAQKIFGGADQVRQRFRHRFEVNPKYVDQLEAGGLVFSGKAENEDIMQMVEVPGHPYFVGCQYHPELISTLLEPCPLFMGLIQAAEEIV